MNFEKVSIHKSSRKIHHKTDFKFKGIFTENHPEHIQDCNIKYIMMCQKLEKVDYCRPEFYDIPIKCMENKLKGNCENYELFFEFVKKIHNFCLERSLCGLDHVFNLDF